MAGRPGQSIIEKHPQKRLIIDRILAGLPLRTIIKDVVPPVSTMAVQRYKTIVVKPLVAKAEAIDAILVRESEAGRTAVPMVSSPNVLQEAKTALLAAPALQIREQRIARANDRAQRFQRIVDERADEMKKCALCGREKEDHPWGDEVTADGPGLKGCDKFIRIAGGSSGFLTRDYKSDGTPIYKFDKALADSFLEHEKQVAIESGQWQENAGGGVSIQIICPAAPQPEELPRIVFSAEGAIEGSAEEVFESVGVLQKPT